MRETMGHVETTETPDDLNELIAEWLDWSQASDQLHRPIKQRIQVQGSRVLVMGLTFKENCPDLRNTRVVDIVQELGEYNMQVDVCDPWVNEEEAVAEYGIRPVAQPADGAYDGIIIAVAHRQFAEMGAAGIRRFGKADHVLYDLKYVISADEADIRL